MGSSASLPRLHTCENKVPFLGLENFSRHNQHSIKKYTQRFTSLSLICHALYLLFVNRLEQKFTSDDTFVY